MHAGEARVLPALPPPKFNSVLDLIESRKDMLNVQRAVKMCGLAPILSSTTYKGTFFLPTDSVSEARRHITCMHMPVHGITHMLAWCKALPAPFLTVPPPFPFAGAGLGAAAGG